MLRRVAEPPAIAHGSRGETRIVEPSARQQTIARRVAEARATVPHLELTAEVDMDACLRLEFGTTAVLLRACALALRRLPLANGAYRDGRFELYSRVNVAVTMATKDAHLAATVFDADQKSLRECSAELQRLEQRARAGELTAPELSGATFTLTHLADSVLASYAPILLAPQAAALGAGAIRRVPVVRDGSVLAGHVMTITLVCDHRILYGAEAIAFLHECTALLERAEL
jgi:pyruvate dehydrogenase E2 component (dihydrolipoamide acetyltransferase)